MEKKWKLWEEQGDLKIAIRDCVELGRHVSNVAERVSKASKGTWSEHTVKRNIKELLEDWLLIAPDGGFEDGHLGDATWVQVSEWVNNDELIQATKQADYSGALMFLFEKGVKHPDMERYGLADCKKEDAEVVSEMATMPDYQKVKRVEGAQGDNSSYNEVPEGAEQITSAVKQAASDLFKTETFEFSVGEILAKSQEISPKEMATELGGWIIANVEQFIDNQESVFRMYLTINSDMAMPMSSLYQRLYLSIPDENEADGIDAATVDTLIEMLNSKLDETKEILSNDKEFHRRLFERMVYFYEITGFVVVDGQVTQAVRRQMDGRVQINELSFDPISLTTTVAQGVGQQVDGKIREGDKKVVIKQEVMPAGFGIEIEIAIFSKNKVPLSMY